MENQLSSLNELEKIILSQYIFYGEGASYSQIYYYNNNLNYSTFISILNSLCKKKLLKKNSFYGYYLESNIRLGLYQYFFKNHPNLLRKIRKSSHSDKANEEYEILNSILNTGKIVEIKTSVALSLFSNLLSQSEELQKKAYKLFPDDYKVRILSSFLERKFLEDTLTDDIIESTYHFIGESACPDLKDVVDLYSYFLKGTFVADSLPWPKRPYSMMLHAIRQCNLGHYDSSFNLFVETMKCLNKTQSNKNMIELTLPSYFYVLTCINLGIPTAINRLTVLYKKRNSSDSIELLPSFALTEAFFSSDHKPLPYSLKIFCGRKSKNSTSLRSLDFIAWLLAKHYNIALEDIPFSTKLPQAQILQHEAREMLRLNEERRNELNKLYGDTPALSSIPIKKEWEWAIDEVMNEIEKIRVNEKTNQTSRIIYSLSPDGTVTPFSQKMLKSGKWSAYKSITKNKFSNSQIEEMDYFDKVFASRTNSLNYTRYIDVWPKLHEVADLFIGSERLYEGDNLVEVHDSAPYIETKKKDNFIYLDSNVDFADTASYNKEIIVHEDGPHKYSVIRLTNSQKEILNRLLKLEKFPVEAEKKVIQFLTNLEEVIEVKSSLIDSKAIPTLAGRDALAIKVAPYTQSKYKISVYSNPLEGGSAYCEPGVGRPIIYSIIDDENKRVKRNMAGESANLNALNDFLEGIDIELGEDYSALINIDSLLELISFVRESQGIFEMEWAKDKRITIKQISSSSNWNVGLTKDNGWFDIEGNVSVDSETLLSMTKLLSLFSESQGKFIKLSDSEYLQIDKSLRKQLERLESITVKNRNKLQISTFNAALLDDKAINSVFKVNCDNDLLELQQRILESNQLNPAVPANLNASLRPYQKEGFQWMCRLANWGAGACLADDMGLGKTLQAIAFFLSKAEEGPALVVAPASVVPNWESEIKKFAPSLNTIVLNNAENRNEAIQNAGPYNVVLTTYGLLNTESAILSEKNWTTVCLDEAHIIKNKETKMSSAAMRLNANYKIILTGTPIQNHLGELWNLFHFINPGLLGTFESFKKKFTIPITQDGNKERQKALRKMIRPFILRRSKRDVIEDLPDKTEVILPIELSKEEMTMYEAMRLKTVEEIQSSSKVDVSILSEITKLRRAACSMSLINTNWKGTDSKLQAFMDIVANFKAEGNRMLVFSQFTSFLEIVRKKLDDAGEPYLYLDGSTSIKQREKLVGEFRRGETPLFLISLKAGGLGLNLPEANYVVHLDPWWNPAIEQQATDRAYRIGQQKAVTVYHLVAKNTIEEKIRRLHRTKQDLADSLLEGSDIAGKLSIEDIMELVRNS